MMVEFEAMEVTNQEMERKEQINYFNFLSVLPYRTNSLSRLENIFTWAYRDSRMLFCFIFFPVKISHLVKPVKSCTSSAGRTDNFPLSICEVCESKNNHKNVSLQDNISHSSRIVVASLLPHDL